MTAADVLRLLPWLALLVGVTLFPFDLQLVAARSVLRADPPWPQIMPVPTDVLLNVMLFVPFGIWLQARWPVSSTPWRAVIAGLLLSSIVETLQGLSPRRDMSVVDLLANSAGTWLGAWVWHDRGPGLRRQLFLISNGLSPLAVAGVMVMLSLATAVVSGTLQRDSRLTSWSREYPLVVGNERTGERPWQGRVIAFTLTDASLPGAAVEAFAVTGLVVLPGRAVAAYAFDGAAPYRDRSSTVPPLLWTPGEPGDSAVFGPGRPWLQSDGPADGLVGRVQASNAFTLRVICASDDSSQSGPARILSNSLDTGHRNFTIAQSESDLVVRLRTAHTGMNGARPETRVPGVFENGGRRDILVTYDGSSLRVTVGQSHRVQQTDFTPGSSLAAAMTSLPLEAHELPMLQRVFVATLFFAPGAVYGLLFAGRPLAGRIAWGIGWVLLSVALVESARAVSGGGPFDRQDAVRTVLVGGVAFAVGAAVFNGFLRSGEAEVADPVIARVRPV